MPPAAASSLPITSANRSRWSAAVGYADHPFSCAVGSVSPWPGCAVWIRWWFGLAVGAGKGCGDRAPVQISDVGNGSADVRGGAVAVMARPGSRRSQRKS